MISLEIRCGERRPVSCCISRLARGEGIRWGFAAENLGFLLHRREAALSYRNWDCDFSWGSGSKAVNRGSTTTSGEHGSTLGWCESLLRRDVS